MDEKALINQNRLLKIALVVSIVLLAVCYTRLNIKIENYISENEALATQIEDLTFQIEEQDYTITEKETKYNDLADENKELWSKYSELKTQYDELELSKSIPVYYCRHNENSAITALRAYMDNAPGFERYGTDGNGQALYYFAVEEYDMWYDWFADVCDYDSYEAAWYLYDENKSVANMIDEVDNAYKSHYDAWFGVEEDEEEE